MSTELLTVTSKDVISVLIENNTFTNVTAGLNNFAPLFDIDLKASNLEINGLSIISSSFAFWTKLSAPSIDISGLLIDKFKSSEHVSGMLIKDTGSLTLSETLIQGSNISNMKIIELVNVDSVTISDFGVEGLSISGTQILSLSTIKSFALKKVKFKDNYGSEIPSTFVRFLSLNPVSEIKIQLTDVSAENAHKILLLELKEILAP